MEKQKKNFLFIYYSFKCGVRQDQERTQKNAVLAAKGQHQAKELKEREK